MTARQERAAIADAVARASDTRAIVTGSGVLAEAGELFVSQFGRHPALLVADETTARVALSAVRERLESAGIAVTDELILAADPTVKPAIELSQTIARRLNGTLAIPVAIGSGTINDLVKYGASLAARPYLVVATAASMDGYAASGSALIANGFKQTFPCPAPRAVLADLDVIRSAPPAMTSSGYADLVGKVTAGADWILAEAVGIETIDAAIWAMVQPWVRDLLPAADLVQSHDPATLETLVNGLLMSGLAMQSAGTSRPASGSEHQFSHYWEMQGLSVGKMPVSHGFKVSIGSLAVTALYESLLALTDSDLEHATSDRWPKFSNIESTINSWRDDPRVIERAIVESRAKYPTNDLRIDHVRRLRANWPEVQRRLNQQLVPAAQLRQILQAAGCPVTPEEIGLSRKRLKGAYAAARQIRRRYTVLDTLTELGRFDQTVNDLFKPSGFWGG